MHRRTEAHALASTINCIAFACLFEILIHTETEEWHALCFWWRTNENKWNEAKLGEEDGENKEW